MIRNWLFLYWLATQLLGLHLSSTTTTGVYCSCLAFQPTPGSRRTGSLPCNNEWHTTSYRSSTRLDLSPAVLIGGGVVVAGVAGWLYVDGAEGRERRQRRSQEEERYRQYQDERARRAFVEPKEYWTEAELAAYDGTKDPDGPILLAADGLVFNVYKGRNFYGPGGEYHLFAGRDATRFLAKTIVEEETPDEAIKPLTMAERAALAAWIFTFKGKYEVVGKLQGFDPKTTSMKSLGS